MIRIKFLISFQLFAISVIGQILPIIIQSDSKGFDNVNQIISSTDNTFTISGGFEDTFSFESSTLKALGYGDGFVAKLDQKVEIRWIQQLGGENFDHIVSITTDSLGDVYVLSSFQKQTGISTLKLKSSGFMGSYIAKMDEKGDIRWVSQIEGSLLCPGTHLAVNPKQELVFSFSFRDSLEIGGNTYFSAGGYDMITGILDKTGNLLWVKQVGGKGSDMVNSVLVTAQSDILIAGSFGDQCIAGNDTLLAGSERNPFIIKFLTNGEISSSYSIPSQYEAEFRMIASDRSNNLYALGNFSRSLSIEKTLLQSHGYQDIFLMKLTPDFKLAWSRSIGGQSNDHAYVIAINPKNELFISGKHKLDLYFDQVKWEEEGSYPQMNAFGHTFVAKFDMEGNLISNMCFPGTSENYCTSIAFDEKGNPWFAGNFSGKMRFGDDIRQGELVATGLKDIFILHYTDPCEEFSIDLGEDIDLLPGQSITLDAGSGYQSYLWNDRISDKQVLVTDKPGKYVVSVTNEIGCMATDSVMVKLVDPIEKDYSQELSLTDFNPVFYPNPTNGILHIYSRSLPAEEVEISIIDIYGSIMILEKKKPSSSILQLDLSSLANGVYTIHVNSSSDSFTGRIVKN